MPKRVIQVKYSCNICDTEYGNRKYAIDCENKGFAVPEFKRKELVLIRLKNVSTEIIAQITNYGPDEGLSDSHRLPGYYDVNVAYRDYNPDTHRPIPENNPLRRHGITIARAAIVKRCRIKKNICPLCGSKKIGKETEKIYDPYCFVQLDFITNVETSVCRNCDIRFFNRTQEKLVNEKIRRSLSSKKLADTKKLIRENQYDFS